MNDRKELKVHNCSPKSLSINDFYEISAVEKDMWAYGIWEYVKCSVCDIIYSKEDIYSEKIIHFSNKTVQEIEQILWNWHLNCNKCDSKILHIYDTEKNIENIKNRLLKTNDSFISLLKEDNDNIVWFIDWYIADFDFIYDNELKDHYQDIWKEKLKIIIENNLKSDLPNYFFSFSSMWTIEKYKSFYNVFSLINSVTNSIDKKYDNVLWITELDKWSNLYSLYNSIWIIWLWLSEYNYAQNKNDFYNSDIFLKPSFLNEAKKAFSMWPKYFLKNILKKAS